MRVISVLLIVLVAACNSKEEKVASGDTTATVVAKSELPNMPVALIDDRMINTSELKGKTILVFFQHDCSHCQEEASAIESNFSSFKDYQLYFISSAEHDEIEKFAVDYKLRGKENVSFGRTEGIHVYNTFGPIEVPSIYIYSETGRLRKNFNGETPIDELKEAL